MSDKPEFDNDQAASKSPARLPQELRQPFVPRIPPEILREMSNMSRLMEKVFKQNQQAINEAIRVSAIFDNGYLNSTTAALNVLATQLRLFDTNQIFDSPAFQQALRANQSLEHLIASINFSPPTAFVDALANSANWQEFLPSQLVFPEFQNRLNMALQGYFAEIAKFSALSETTLARIQWDHIGNALEIQVATRKALQTTFGEFSTSYSDFFIALEARPAILTLAPPIINRLPSFEYFNAVTVIDQITIKTDEDAELNEETEQAKEQTRLETRDRLEFLLARLNTDLVTPLRGSRLALDSSNPDRVRHFAVSLRELFTQVIHMLAPDDVTNGWSAERHLIDANGRPTRRARLLYICRALNDDPFTKFLEKDVAAMVEFLDLFQQGTHGLVPKYTDLQLVALQTRMESLLRFLLEIWNAS